MEGAFATAVVLPTANVAAISTTGSVSARNANSFLAPGVRRSSFLSGQSAVSVEKRATFQAKGFEVSASIPLLPYKPTTTNSRVDSIGQDLISEKPKSYSTELKASTGEIAEVIYAAYRQIYGEHAILDAWRQVSLESLLRFGEITVKDFVKGLLMSEPFLSENKETNSNYYFVQKVVQRVLGRDVYNKQERIAWSIVIADKGIESFYDAILGSDEYMTNFGDYTVPYQRVRVLSGRPGSDGEVPYNIKSPRSNQFEQYKPYTPAPVPSFGSLNQRNRADFAVTTDVAAFKVTPDIKYNIGAAAKGSSVPLLYYAFKTQNARVESIGTTLTDETPRLYSTSFQPGPAESGEIIWAAYRQIFSEHQILKSQRCVTLETEVRDGRITVKDFIRGIAQSPQFLALNYTVNSNYRFVEMMVQRILGRDVYSEREKIAWSIVICNEGPIGFINALVDSDEYAANFGDDVVPYQRSRVLPQRAVGEMPFNLKTPRYGDYWRNTYCFFDQRPFLVKRIKPTADAPAMGDPARYKLLTKTLGLKYDNRPYVSVSIPSNFLSKVPARTLEQ